MDYIATVTWEGGHLEPGECSTRWTHSNAVQLCAATLLRLSEHLQAPERGGRLMIAVDGLTPLPTTELDDYLVVCKEFPDAGAALGRHLAWELGSDDATAVLSRGRSMDRGAAAQPTGSWADA